MERIELDQNDVAPGRALRARFAAFWAGAEGDPKDIYDQFTGWTPEHAEVSFAPSDLDGVAGIWAEPARALEGRAILFIHGGGYGLGSAKGYRGLTSQLAARTRTRVFSLQYPLSSEAQLPVALDLALDALEQLSKRFSSIAISGDSSGGGMALATLARAPTQSTAIAAGAVFSPWTDLSLSGQSLKDNGISDPLLDPAYLRASAKAYLGSASSEDPRGSPLCSVPSGLPPVMIQVGSDEVLLDDSKRYADVSKAAGNDVTLEEYVGMHHVFQLSVAELATSRMALDRAAAFLVRHLDKFRTGAVADRIALQ